MPAAPAAPGPVTAGPTPMPGRAPGPAAPTRTPTLEIEPGSPTFDLRLGEVVVPIPLSGDLVHPKRGGGLTIDLRRAGLAMPGLRFTELELVTAAGVPTGGTLKADVSAPFVRGHANLNVDAHGSLSGGVHLETTVAILGNPAVDFSYVDRQWQGTLSVEGRDLRLPIPNVTVDEGRATISFRGDHLIGSLSARFHHAALGEGNINVTLSETGVAGEGGFRLTMPLLAGSAGRFTFADGQLGAELDLTAAAVHLPVPGLALTELAGHVALARGRISGTASIGAEYAGLARIRVSDVRFGNRGFESGTGQLDVTAPALAGSGGRFRLSRDGGLDGTITIHSDKIPIPAIRRGKVVITFRPDGGVDVAGEGTVTLGRIATGDIYVRYENGVLSLGARNVVLTARLPGVEQIEGNLEYTEGQLQGSLGVAVAIGPLSGRVLLVYRDRVLSGEGRLTYVMGRFNGWVLVRLSPEGQFSGEGEAQFRLTDWLTGRIALVLHPNMNVDARGELVFTDEIQLVDHPWQFDHSFFNFDQEFPLWGITIPVVGSIGIVAEVHANAGFRARFGPPVLRNIRAVGEVSTRPGVEPTFEISGDLNIPAGAEIVLIVGGGIGLSVLVAKISGGIDLEGVAGVYGAITLTPTFAYRDGKYMLRGDALLQATAQLRARLNAYAKVKVGVWRLTKTVWSENWKLAEWIFDTGWNVGVRASIAYTLGEPFVPDVHFDEVAVDPIAIIKGAIPESGEPVPAPARPPTPVAEFRPAEGEAGTVAAGPAAPGTTAAAPPPSHAGPGSAAVEPAAGGASAEPISAAAAEPAAAPGAALNVDPPAAIAEQPEERSVEEQYLVYVYDQVERFLHRQKNATAPSDEELRRKAMEAADADRGPIPERERSAGRPLSPGVKDKMETIFQEDFSDVRVHTDETARESARDLGADAYTVGHDIYFAPSREPEAGQEDLLAHELAHVVQDAGDGSDRVSRPADELEKEAEEAGEAVRRGEAPQPIRKREGDAGIHRAAASAAPSSPSAVSRVPFSRAEWERIRNSTDVDERLKEKIATLLGEDQVKEKVADEAYDERTNTFRPRRYVPMRFPGHEYLSHKNLYGDTQITEGENLVRVTGERNDTKQNELVKLMYAVDKATGESEFSRSPDEFRERDWARYLVEPAYVNATRRSSTPDTADLAAAVNLRLTRTGFDAMCDAGFRYKRPATVAGTESGWWERVGAGAGRGVTRARDSAARATLRNDYQAHHVIPLWLRSPSHPSGDQLANLVPWHRAAHQVNHAYHQSVPENVRDLTGVADYRKYKEGTVFKLMIGEGAGKPPEQPPAVRLDTRGDASETEPPTTQGWVPTTKAPWMA